MSVTKAADVLADELRERILTGEFADGAGLPAERDLVTSTRMSRTTVREALRILEVQGLVRIRPGRSGGAFVQRPGAEDMASTVNLVIRGRDIRVTALLETREAIEPFCAGLAAAHRTAEELEVLEEANRAVSAEPGDLAGFLQANIDWHVAVARASHNELLAGLMTALARSIHASTENEMVLGSSARRLTIRQHESITAAIRDRDAEAAVRRMKRHLRSSAAELRQHGDGTETDSLR